MREILPCASAFGAIAMFVEASTTQKMKRRKTLTALKLRFAMTVATAIPRCKRAATFGAAMIFLTACGGIDLPNPINAINEVAGLKKVPTSIQVFGVVSSDDPASSSVGSSIILRGGNAADAAAAMAFGMTVTFPSRAGSVVAGSVLSEEAEAEGFKYSISCLLRQMREKSRQIDPPQYRRLRVGLRHFMPLWPSSMGHCRHRLATLPAMVSW